MKHPNGFSRRTIRSLGALLFCGGSSLLAQAGPGSICTIQHTYTVGTPRGQTGTIQTFTVPTVGQVVITAVGGAGSDSFNNGIDGELGTGGNGADVTATFGVTPGTVLNFLVGAQGGEDLGNGVGGGGGGGTFVYSGPFSAFTASDTLLIVAGGGGGATGLVAANGSPGQYQNLTLGPASSAAVGHGGFSFNNAGAGANAGGSAGAGGGGGNSTSGGGGGGIIGNGGSGVGFFSGSGGASLANGGGGGTGPTTGSLTGGNGGYGGGGSGANGGGGGGGYSGGGGGDYGGGGGGGGSFVDVSALSFSAAVAGAAGDGQVNLCFVAASDSSYQVLDPDNLNLGDSYVNLTNSGASGASLIAGTTANVTGTICANLYVFAPDEQLMACCSCPVTPNGANTLSVKNDLLNNVLEPQLTPDSVGIAVTATAPLAGSCNGSAYSSMAAYVPGLAGWGTSLHANTSVTPPTYALTEVPFVPVSLSAGEAARLTELCMLLSANGSGAGICNSCKVGGQ